MKFRCVCHISQMGGLMFSLMISTLLNPCFAKSPEKIKTLEISKKNASVLSEIGVFSNLRELHISCLEDLKELPEKLGSLSKLEVLSIDNSNGCVMDPVLPESLGKLRN